MFFGRCEKTCSDVICVITLGDVTLTSSLQIQAREEEEEARMWKFYGIGASRGTVTTVLGLSSEEFVHVSVQRRD
jgi:hypothetical protein